MKRKRYRYDQSKPEAREDHPKAVWRGLLSTRRTKGGDGYCEKVWLATLCSLGEKRGVCHKKRQSPDYYSRIGLLGREAKRKKKFLPGGEDVETNRS